MGIMMEKQKKLTFDLHRRKKRSEDDVPSENVYVDIIVIYLQDNDSMNDKMVKFLENCRKSLGFDSKSVGGQITTDVVTKLCLNLKNSLFQIYFIFLCFWLEKEKIAEKMCTFLMYFILSILYVARVYI